MHFPDANSYILHEHTDQYVAIAAVLKFVQTLQYHFSIIHTAMDKNTKYDTGESGCGSPYYSTTMEPKDWWMWFKGI